jgi:arabinogalactan endo-1,4-beta-galactosidase
MHKIHAKEFTLYDFSHEKLTTFNKNVVLEDTIRILNDCRNAYLLTKDRMWWDQMIQLLPTSYNQKRTVMLNYEVLVNIYHSRKNHKLDEWHVFCDWIRQLPYSELITGGE